VVVGYKLDLVLSEGSKPPHQRPLGRWPVPLRAGFLQIRPTVSMLVNRTFHFVVARKQRGIASR
jgi:hypothetical protein